MFSLTCGSLRNNQDTRGISDNGGETPVEPGRWSGWGEGGRINEGITSIDIMYICEITNVNLNILYGEGEAGGKPTKCCVHVCHYHYELHYDVRL